MKIHVLPRGVGSRPLVLDASQVVVFNSSATPVMVAYDIDDRTVMASHQLDGDFPATLRRLGLDDPGICDRLVLPPPPPGAVLIAGPHLNRGRHAEVQEGQDRRA